MGKIEKKHEIFVLEMITHGDQVRAYMAAYPNSKRNAARVSAYKLLQKDTIKFQLKEASDKIRTQAEQEAKEQLKGMLVNDSLVRDQRLAILSKIASGELEKDKVIINNKGQAIRIKVKPDHNDRLKAIDLMNKMTGDYAPEKRELTGANGQPLIPAINITTVSSLHEILEKDEDAQK